MNAALLAVLLLMGGVYAGVGLEAAQQLQHTQDEMQGLMLTSQGVAERCFHGGSLGDCAAARARLDTELRDVRAPDVGP